jgi:predicted glutamine amidotransferase
VPLARLLRLSASARGPALCKPTYSLIDQSLYARLGATTTNGDGFGVGWYTDAETPGLFRSVEPAWNDRNLRELAGHVRSPLFFARIRASTGTAIQQTNCHPFRYGRWLWMHNGVVGDFPRVKRDLVLTIDERLYPWIEGSADSEVLFYLALTSASTKIRRRPSPAWSASSRRPGDGTESSIPSR